MGNVIRGFLRDVDHDGAMGAVLLLLLGPYELAQAQEYSPLDFGWELGWLRHKGVSAGVVAAGVKQGYLTYEPERQSPRGGCDDGELAPSVSGLRSRVTLTEAGAARAWELVGEHRNGAGGKIDERRKQRQSRPKPRWDSHRRELWCGGMMILALRRHARNQALIVAGFQELGWPKRLDDPLTPLSGIDPYERLRQTIKRLNQGQNPLTLRFRVEADGQSVCWSTES
jgi:hypothetical protein